jgi:ferredoxin-thioredoxin reductase catalytic subunit
MSLFPRIQKERRVIRPWSSQGMNRSKRKFCSHSTLTKKFFKGLVHSSICPCELSTREV